MGVLEILFIFEISWLFMCFVIDYFFGGFYLVIFVEWFVNVYNVIVNKGYLFVCSLEEVFNWDLVLLFVFV